MAYDEHYIWDRTDKHGASLKTMTNLAERYEYALVGTNLNGTNAFFVRADLANDLFPKPATAENLYNPVRAIGHIAGHKSVKCLVDDIAEPKPNVTEVITDIPLPKATRFAYNRYRILSQITFGKMRKHYEAKRKAAKRSIL
jgi:hypothetical protein